ncbi:serine/threonine-protein phosphatase [Streptomyces flavofungini]|uniref:Serine/threonine-protein phosphatase n=1 Tax=Streptomyces flavofungini TaxID=68200 RepID=A0ABS0XHI9_9ACTN|nr:PP2C family protein-serine/threonine phosphatase [Streptomyces flavofungini]MBJ3812688.1 serine/threonine-protein phosphatase [Streptomyces flavofungini]
MAALTGVAALALFLPHSRRQSLLTGGATLGAALFLGALEWRDRPIVIIATLANIIILTVLARYLGRTRSEATTGVAEPGSQRNASSQIGNVHVEVRTLPMLASGEMSADFCDLRSTSFGARLLVVDFMGKDTATQEKASSLLYQWARAAGEAPGLGDLARRLDSLLAQEDLFAKALLVDVADDGTTTLLCCGHPPPLVVEDCAAHPLSLVSLLPPLGLFHLVHEDIPIYATTILLTPGRRLLLHTDGASDTPDADGAFYPLAARLGSLDGLAPGECLDRMAAELRQHMQERARDEALLLLIECTPPSAASVAPLHSAPREEVAMATPWTEVGQAAS